MAAHLIKGESSWASANLETEHLLLKSMCPIKTTRTRPGMLGTVTINNKSNERSVAILVCFGDCKKETESLSSRKSKMATSKDRQTPRAFSYRSGWHPGIDEVIIRGHRELNEGDDVIVVKLEG